MERQLKNISNGVKKITWVNLLHFYQPPTADNETVVQAAEKSYRRIIGALKRNPNIKFTVNIAGCLLEKLDQLGFNDLISDLRRLYRKKQIELTGSAAYHPILPLLPEKEVRRNIEVNQKILKKYFGPGFKAKGFFPPELAYDQKLAKIIKSYHYDWIILDEISAGGRLADLNDGKLYLEKTTGLKIFFRPRRFSKSYVPKIIFGLINDNFKGTVITATDAELYGLRHSDQTATFEKLLKRREIKTLTVSEFLAGLDGTVVKLTPAAGSWESTAAELKKGQPFLLWQNPKNNIQQLLWRLADLAIKTVGANQADASFAWARRHLDRGLASCTFWWASARDFKLFGAISWNPDEIERGLNELIRSIRALANPKTKPAKIAGEKLYLKIKQLTWHKHWHYYWGK